jgi:hypothetical protein
MSVIQEMQMRKLLAPTIGALALAELRRFGRWRKIIASESH